MSQLPAPRSESLGRRLRERVSRSWNRRRSSISPGVHVKPSKNISVRPNATASVSKDPPTEDSQLRTLGRPLERSLPTSDTTRLPKSPSSGSGNVNPQLGPDGDAQDVWSAAFREAVATLGEDIDVATLQGKSIQQLFARLEELDKDATQGSTFLRGVRFLQSIEVPLKNFKLAIDLASPLATFEPTAKVVFGVITGITAIAISFASADAEFGKQIGQMLEQLSYVDECDTLGQRANKEAIHKALVSVYSKILEFYKAAFNVLSQKQVKLVLKLVLENNRIPSIVDEFLKCAEHLHRLVQSATAEIIYDIRAMLYDQQISRWLGGDKIERQSEYHAHLGDLRSGEGWEFLLDHPDLAKWYNSPMFAELVISGNMGTGKSVAASFLIEELKRRRKCRLPRPMVCYHYCRDDETGRITHILSVLVLSLLQQLPGLTKTFHSWYEANKASGNVEPAKDSRRLAIFLGKTLESLDRPLFIVIDGLDECDQRSRIDLLALLRSSSQLNSSVKYVLVSRPDAGLLDGVHETLRIFMDANFERDQVIATHTVDRELGHLALDLRTIVIEQLSHSAKGSAIWTKMVVELIKGRQVRALAPLRKLLTELPLPSQLSALYDSLLLRYASEDAENQVVGPTALMILAASSRHLTVSELAWATALALAPLDVSTVAALSDLVDAERVLALVRPFIALDDAAGIAGQNVRLVHQSVKEYVYQKARLEWLTTPSTIPSAPFSVWVHNSSDLLLSVCMQYLLLRDVGEISLFSEELKAIEALPPEVDIFDEDIRATTNVLQNSWAEWEAIMIHYDPVERGLGELFVYASCHWVDHLAIVEEGTLPNLGDIETICAAGSTRLENWTQQLCRPGCIIMPRFEFVSERYDPLGIVSHYGSACLLQHMVMSADFTTKAFHPYPANAVVRQILYEGDPARLQIILQGRKDRLPFPLDDFWSIVLTEWTNRNDRHRDWDVVFLLVDDMTDMLVREDCANELLCMAARAGCLPLLHRLFDLGQQDAKFRHEMLRNARHEASGARGEFVPHQSIGEAVLGNHIDAVTYLLQQDGLEPHLHYTNAHEENVMHLASIKCNAAIFRQLAPYFAQEPEQTDDQGRSVLTRVISSSASFEACLDCARILLAAYSASGRNYTSSQQQNPLSVARRLGDVEMSSLLMAAGFTDSQSVLTVRQAEET